MNSIQNWPGVQSNDLWENLTRDQFIFKIQNYKDKELIEFLSKKDIFGNCCNLELFFSDTYTVLKKLSINDLILLFSIPGVKKKLRKIFLTS